MRLLDLSPRWLEYQGQRIAIMFKCPHCVGRLVGNRTSPDEWLTCFFRPIAELPTVPDDYPVEGLRGKNWHRVLFYEALREMGHSDPVGGAYHDIVSCKKSIAWQRVGDDLASVSVTPSIDASAAGHWHGFITNGEIR